MLAKLYRGGRSAVIEMQEFLQCNGLSKCHAAQELATLALIVDRMMATGSQDVINMPALEVLARRMYGLLNVFQDVKSEHDWKMPKGVNAKQWKTKVRWELLDEYDVASLDKQRWAIDDVDEEVQTRLKAKAQIRKHLPEASDRNDE